MDFELLATPDRLKDEHPANICAPQFFSLEQWFDAQLDRDPNPDLGPPQFI